MHDEPKYSMDYSYGSEAAPASPPAPETRKRRRSRPGRLWRLGMVLSGLLSFAIVITAFVIGAIYYLKQRLTEPGPLATEKIVIIAPGAGLSRIARTLERDRVIDNAELFIVGVTIDRAEARLRAGEYRFDAGVSMKDVMAKLIAGKSVKHKITLPEGLTSYQIVEKLKSDPVLVGDIVNIPPEGTLLPETYLFQRGRKRSEIIADMAKAQRDLLDSLWEKRAKNLPFSTRQEALTLASIVEKETAIAAERPRVAAVFINRLRRNVRLQSDPTIIYGISGGKGRSGRPILRSEINSKTPYNTYQIDGLPPTPIANPGRASIEAVLNPIESNELFFVADGTGGHVFAETLRDHQKNVAKWRKIETGRRKAAAAAGAAAKKSDKGAPPADKAPVSNAGKKTNGKQ